MAERPKLETVASVAGVSVATASQVMRGAGRISAKTRERVLAAARQLKYLPDGRAAAMRSGVNRDIGFAIHEIANPFNAEVISGVSDLLETEGYLVAVLDSRDNPERQRKQLEAFIRSSRGGLLWVPAAHTPSETLELLKAHQMPTVTFLRHLQRAQFDHVGIEDAEATARATHYLADLGHRTIAYLGGNATFGVRLERIAGYRRALAERSDVEPLIWESPDNKRAGLDAMLALHRAHPDITAVVCNGDMVAIGASLGLQKIGLQPGRDVSLIGFDDIPDAGIAIPPLSTMAVDPYQLGRRLARTLVDRITEPDSPTATVRVTAELIIRETTAPPVQFQLN